MLALWKKFFDQPRQHIKKQRHYFDDKSPSSQNYIFFPVVMYGCESWIINKAALQLPPANLKSHFWYQATSDLHTITSDQDPSGKFKEL